MSEKLNIDKPFTIKSIDQKLTVRKVGKFGTDESVFLIGLESSAIDQQLIVGGDELKKLVGYVNAHLILDKHED